MFPAEVVKKLSQPLESDRIKSRSKAGRSLSYLEGWDVIAKANEIFGVDLWGYEVTRLEHVGTSEFAGSNNRKGWKTAYFATVKVTIIVADTPIEHPCRVIVEEVGYGDDTGYSSAEETHELAVKEAVTDALKRALKKFGDQFGLCLYDKTYDKEEDKAKAETASKAAPQEASKRDTSGDKDLDKSVPATEERLQELYAALKDAGKEPTWISAEFTKVEMKNNGIIPAIWVERQLTNLSLRGES